MDELEKRTGGKVKFQKYYSESLAKGPDLLDAASTGMADIVILFAAYTPAKVPITWVTFLPRGDVRSTYPLAMANWELYNTMPEYKAEYDKYGVRVIADLATFPAGILSKDPVRNLSDVKGKKIRATGFEAQVLDKAGGVPVSLAYGEIYTAMSQGLVSGHFHGPATVVSLGTQELGKYYLDLQQSQGTFRFILNQKTFERLPADVQKTIEDFAQDATTGMCQFYDKVELAGIDKMKAAGVQISQPTAEDKAKLADIYAEIANKWITDAKGLPAQKVYSEWDRLVKKYGAQKQ